jgi:dipeptidyl aminopeptidase/acylaminoacyl peptidase
VAYADAAFARDGRSVFVASDEDAEFKKLRRIDLATGAITELAPDLHWDVEAIAAGNDGRVLAYVANEDGIARLRLLDLRSGKSREASGIPAGQIGSMKFDPESRRLALSISAPRTAGDTYVYDLADDTLERWTESEIGGLDPEKFAEPRLIHYPTFDTVGGRPREIPAFYYRPERKGPLPVLIVIHGGPESQSTPGFSARVPMFNNELGLAVITPNVRGSNGYGKSFLKLDNGMLREDSVRDIGALLDWIAKQPELDASRVAVFGGSYGGYMVLASMVHYGDRLRCGVDIVGISNFVSFLENTESYRRDLRRAEYGDESDPGMRAFMERIAPLNNADRIRKPMYIVQGQNDPRVPMGESEQIVRAVRENGQTVWYLLARDEGHGFARKSNNDYLYAALVRFLETYLIQ